MDTQTDSGQLATAAAVAHRRRVQWRVAGFALIPVGAVAYVEAATAEEALLKAQAEWARDKRSLLVPNSEDDSAAFNWQPTAEPLNVSGGGAQ